MCSIFIYYLMPSLATTTQTTQHIKETLSLFIIYLNVGYFFFPLQVPSGKRANLTTAHLLLGKQFIATIEHHKSRT